MIFLVTDKKWWKNGKRYEDVRECKVWRYTNAKKKMNELNDVTARKANILKDMGTLKHTRMMQ